MDLTPARLRRWTLVCAASLMLVSLPGCATTEKTVQVRPKLIPAPDAASASEKLPAPTTAELIARGDSAMRRGELNLAVVEYVKALVEDPENPELLIRIGDAQRELGQFEIAERAYGEVLLKTPRNAAAMEGIGLVFMNQRRSAAARERLEAALLEEPGRWRALNALGIMSDLAGDHDQAKGHFSKAQQALTNPAHTSLVLNNLGYSFYLSGDLDQAMRYFEEAVTADADNRKAWSNLALVHVRKQQYGHALDSFTRILGKPESFNSVGFLCMVTEQNDCAVEYFQRAIKASPVYYSEAYANLSRVSLKMSNGPVATP